MYSNIVYGNILIESSVGLRYSFLKLNKLLKNLILLSAISTCLPLTAYGIGEFWHDSIQPTRPMMPTLNTIDSLVNDITSDMSDESNNKTNVTPNYTIPQSSTLNSFTSIKQVENDTLDEQYSPSPSSHNTNEMGSLYAQEQTKLSKEQALIKDIEIQGANNVSNELIRSQMQLRSGSHYSRDMLMLDLKAIYEMGYFTENMKALPTSNSDGTVSIQIIVEENAPITDFTIEGNTVVSTEEILDVLFPLKGQPQNIGMLNQAIAEVQKLYIDKGYILSRIDSVTDDPDGTINISIVEGKVNKI